VQRIVVTSSCSAVHTPSSKPTVFSERDWDVSAIEEVRKMGNKSAPLAIYRASKALAEKGSFSTISSFDFILCVL